MKHTFQEDREIDESLVADCRTADQWVRKTNGISKDAWRTARAYLRAKQNFLDKVDAILEIRVEHSDDKAAA